MPSCSVTDISKCIVYPEKKSTVSDLRLSVSDLPMLSCHYIQKGVLLTRPPPSFSFDDLVSSLRRALSSTLSLFPALAGRFSTSPAGHIYVTCNDAGVEFVAASAKHVTVSDVLSPGKDVPLLVREFFVFERLVSYNGHHKPLAAVQVTELDDGVFVGCTVNHSVTDGTSFWHFFNTFADLTSGACKIKHLPDFSRHTVFDSPSVLRVPRGGPRVTFDADQPLRERIFHFSREAISKLKQRTNNKVNGIETAVNTEEILGKVSNDGRKCNGNGNGEINGKITTVVEGFLKSDTNKKNYDRTAEISSFQSLSAQLWRSVTRARNLDPSKTTTFRMAVNCRHRLEPKMDPYYFGNAIQSIPTMASAGDLLTKDLRWSADQLHRNVVSHDDATVRRGIASWESDPRLFPLGNPDGASITMGSSPRFPMYDNDFGWGKPLAVRSGGANKFDGKISAFPGREGNGSVDLEVVLAPETMAGVENDPEFMQYVSEVTYYNC
uniref:Putative acetyltransferase n=1 Tax=Noccaea caerulescens TaxID=107243 RepID=A0A1J3FMD5_NOCCA